MTTEIQPIVEWRDDETWSGVEWSDVEWSGSFEIKWSGVEWSGVEWRADGRQQEIRRWRKEEAEKKVFPVSSAQACLELAAVTAAACAAHFASFFFFSSARFFLLLERHRVGRVAG